MEVIEGYYLLMGDVVFYAKGIEHPPGKVIAYPKYVPDPRGWRRDREGKRYRKLMTQEEQWKYLESCCRRYLVDDPHIGGRVPEIPLNSFDRVYDPIERARELIERRGRGKGIEMDAADMLSDLGQESDLIGLSGSILVGLHGESSDIDLVVYGESSGRRVYEALRERIEEGKEYRRYTERDARVLYERRRKETPLSWEEFLKQEERRILEGYFRNREYSIRLIKLGATYGSKMVRKVGRAKLILEILDGRDSIFTPCKYSVRTLSVIEGPDLGRKVEFIYSLRERFTEIALEGEIVEAEGEIEEWTYKTGERVILLYLGRAGDYMKVLGSN